MHVHVDQVIKVMHCDTSLGTCSLMLSRILSKFLNFPSNDYVIVYQCYWNTNTPISGFEQIPILMKCKWTCAFLGWFQTEWDLQTPNVVTPFHRQFRAILEFKLYQLITIEDHALNSKRMPENYHSLFITLIVFLSCMTWYALPFANPILNFCSKELDVNDAILLSIQRVNNPWPLRLYSSNRQWSSIVMLHSSCPSQGTMETWCYEIPRILSRNEANFSGLPCSSGLRAERSISFSVIAKLLPKKRKRAFNYCTVNSCTQKHEKISIQTCM